MPEVHPIATPPSADSRIRRKERLYVSLQSLGWLAYLCLSVFFSFYFVPESERGSPSDMMAASARVILTGWLLTHFARRWIKRWNWHRLGWVALVPRATTMAFGLSLLWSAFGFGFHFLVLRDEWSAHYPPVVIIAVSVINGTVLMLGWLSLYFCYHVFDRYNTSEIERLRLESFVKDAELRALKAQVNPHFIFNALNSVRALVDEDPARARQAITQLANLLRYSLQSGGHETVPFEDELKAVKDYLALEQVRHEERLRLRFDLAPEVLAHAVPPMLLQTLVENAVKYGISTRADGGEIGIECRLRSDHLEIRVTNPGRLGGPASALAAESTGLGLRNAGERLRLIFGEQSSLDLREEPAGCVVAVARVPRIDSGNDRSTTSLPQLRPTAELKTPQEALR